MPIEIERRFIVIDEGWKSLAKNAKEIRQGYISSHKNGWTVRIRIIDKHEAWITLKIKATKTFNNEFEYQIPTKDAEEIWELTSARIYKTRYSLNLDQKLWIVDCFHENNFPLVLAEIELSSQSSKIKLPHWCGSEISGQYDWSNAELAKTPISIKSIETRLQT